MCVVHTQLYRVSQQLYTGCLLTGYKLSSSGVTLSVNDCMECLYTCMYRFFMSVDTCTCESLSDVKFSINSEVHTSIPKTQSSIEQIGVNITSPTTKAT